MKATVQQRAGLEAFADPKSRPDQLAAGGLAAHEDKYDFKSENVIELLKQLKLKFEDDKLAGTKAETNAINAYDLTREASDNAHKAATKVPHFTRKLTWILGTLSMQSSNALATKDSKQAQTSVPMPSLCPRLSTSRVVRSRSSHGNSWKSQ